jgi:hypothetical protein
MMKSELAEEMASKGQIPKKRAKRSLFWDGYK